MTKIEFLFHLREVSYQALKFVENYVKTELKTNFRYNVIFTEYTNDTIHFKFEILEEDCDKMKLDLSDEEVVEFLHRKGKVPIRIDVNVLKSSRKSSTFNLLCSERYSDNKEDFYYKQNSSAPFGVKSSKLPIGHKE